jgi:mono/diheme cytochrome c family protein
MHVDPKLEPLVHTEFFPNGMASRPMVEGTVARGELQADTYFYTGMAGGQPGNEMPFPATLEVLQRGHQRFNIYCSPCHSEMGDGNGIVVQRGFRRPPSFHTDRLRQAPLGHFFDVMTHGFGAMPDYAAQVPTADRWAIAAYIRALQLSQSATHGDVPAGQQLPSATAAAPGGGQ